MNTSFSDPFDSKGLGRPISDARFQKLHKLESFSISLISSRWLEQEPREMPTLFK